MFAAFMSSFLEARAPYAQDLWKRRMEALDPYTKLNAYATLVNRANETYDAYSRMYAAKASADAAASAEALRLTQTIITDQTNRARIDADLAIANQKTAADLAQARTISTAAGVSTRDAADAMFGTFRDSRNVDQLRNDLNRLRNRVNENTNPGEREALVDHVNSVAQQVLAELPEADRAAVAAEVRALFPAVSQMPAVPQVGGSGVGPANYNAAAQQAERLAGQFGVSSGSASTKTGDSLPAMPLPDDLNALNAQLRKQLDELNPYDSLGWHGDPVPVPEQALVAHLRRELQAGRVPAPVRAAQQRAVAAAAPARPAAAPPRPPAAPPVQVGAPPVPSPPPTSGSATTPAVPAAAPPPQPIPFGARATGYPGKAETAPYVYVGAANRPASTPRRSSPRPTSGALPPRVTDLVEQGMTPDQAYTEWTRPRPPAAPAPPAPTATDMLDGAEVERLQDALDRGLLTEAELILDEAERRLNERERLQPAGQ